MMAKPFRRLYVINYRLDFGGALVVRGNSTFGRRLYSSVTLDRFGIVYRSSA
jgi:hypothetical protein